MIAHWNEAKTFQGRLKDETAFYKKGAVHKRRHHFGGEGGLRIVYVCRQGGRGVSELCSLQFHRWKVS